MNRMYTDCFVSMLRQLGFSPAALLHLRPYVVPGSLYVFRLAALL